MKTDRVDEALDDRLREGAEHRSLKDAGSDRQDANAERSELASERDRHANNTAYSMGKVKLDSYETPTRPYL